MRPTAARRLTLLALGAAFVGAGFGAASPARARAEDAPPGGVPAAPPATGTSPGASTGATPGTPASAAAGTGPSAAPEDDGGAYSAAIERALGLESQLVDTLARVRQSSVSVLIKKNPPAAPDAKEPPKPVVVGCGSGVIVTWNQRTWIITNDHVAAGADAIDVVTFDGRTLAAELVDTVHHYDIALLKFAGRPSGLKGVPIIARASKDLAEGQWVLATGNPFFLATDGQSVSTLGVISGLDRVLGGDMLYGSAIQHDAAVNPGNSGGPLWNLKGELIGINGMIASRGGGGVGASSTGASFSIPIHQIQPYLAKMADARQDAQAGFLGLACETSVDGKGTPNGARVSFVDPRSPARGPNDNGLVKDDVIVSLSVGGRVLKILTSTDLVNALTTCPAGTAVRVRYRRRTRETTWSGKLGAEQ